MREAMAHCDNRAVRRQERCRRDNIEDSRRKKRRRRKEDDEEEQERTVFYRQIRQQRQRFRLRDGRGF